MQLGSPRPLNYMRIRGFNGTSDFYSNALNLSAETKVTLSFWLYWNAYANDDLLAAEYSPNWNVNYAFIIDPNAGSIGVSGKFGFGMSGPGFWTDGFTRPTATAWHHILLIMDRAGPTNTAYVDGVLQALTAGTHNAGTYSTFANSTLYLMSRAGTTLFGAGKQGSFGLWGSSTTLTAGQITSLAAYQLPSTVQKSGLLLEVTW